VIAGREGYEILGGEIEFRGEDLMDMEADERAHLGLFLAFQYPVEIPGVNTTYFLKSAINETRKARGEKELDAVEFLKFIKSKAKLLDLPEDFLKRSLNVGFSGGEKKRNEIFQMAALEPVMAVLDETDSGLDIDALKVVANGVNQLRGPESAQLVITHYQRLLDYIVPDVVHVLHDGRIIKTGPKELAHELEDKGYDWVIKEAEQPA
jgi:Fe-S cluster assembly ATP-binding protein